MVHGPRKYEDCHRDQVDVVDLQVVSQMPGRLVHHQCQPSKMLLWLLIGSTTSLWSAASAASSAAYPSVLDAVQPNQSQHSPGSAWDSVDLQRAQQDSRNREKSDLDDLLHWAIGEAREHCSLSDIQTAHNWKVL